METLSAKYSLLNENKKLTSFYKDQRDLLWNPEEISFESDAKDYLNPNTNQRYKDIYKMFLQFFVVGDGLITDQALSFASSATSQQERMFLLAQLLNEQDHIKTYTNALTQVVPEKERDDVFKAVDNIQCIKDKANFILKWCESDEDRATKYLAGAFAEGVFFAALFAMVFYFRRKNIFLDFIKANQFILRDESLHRDFDCYMAKSLVNKVDTDKAKQIAKEAYDIEISHMNHILVIPIDSEEADKEAGITKENMTKYIQTLTDQILVLSGFEPLFNVEKTCFPWMEDINLVTKKNFYETLVTDYSSGIKENEENNDDIIF